MFFASVKNKIKKTRAGQSALEFLGISSLVIILMFGTIDLFNCGITYMQLTFIGNTLLNNKMMGKSQFGNETSLKNLSSNLEAKSKREGFPLIFIFKNGTQDSGPAIAMETTSDTRDLSARASGRTRGGSSDAKSFVNKTWCVNMKRDVKLTIGRVIVQNEVKTIERTICAIQETDTLNSSTMS